ncbi:hypothetical protein PLESTM_000947200 [Pleodorina starrii]|nr:hypothetical protein PLESTM_000947200 [Pleodorina starrii]
MRNGNRTRLLCAVSRRRRRHHRHIHCSSFVANRHPPNERQHYITRQQPPHFLHVRSGIGLPYICRTFTVPRRVFCTLAKRTPLLSSQHDALRLTPALNLVPCSPTPAGHDPTTTTTTTMTMIPRSRPDNLPVTSARPDPAAPAQQHRRSGGLPSLRTLTPPQQDA